MLVPKTSKSSGCWPTPITTPRCPSNGFGASEASKRFLSSLSSLSQSMCWRSELVAEAPQALSKRLNRSQMRPCRMLPRSPPVPLASSDQTLRGARRACRRWLVSLASQRPASTQV